MTSDGSRYPVYLMVLDNKPDLADWAPYGNWEIPQGLPQEVFWKIVLVNVEQMMTYMTSVGVPTDRMKWQVNVSLLTYDQLYDSIPD